MECIKSIEKKACVEAQVRIIPDAEAGQVEFLFVGGPKREICEETLCPECDFILSQMMCVKIPIKFSTEAAVVKTGIVCEKKHEDCDSKPHPCDDMREREEFLFPMDYPEIKHGRPFARNYLLTYRNNYRTT